MVPFEFLIITTGSSVLCSWQHQIHQPSTQTKGISTRHIWFILFDWIDYESIYLFLILFPSFAGIPLKENMKNNIKKTWHNNTASDKIYLYTQQKKKTYKKEIHSICLIKSKVRKYNTKLVFQFVSLLVCKLPMCINGNNKQGLFYILFIIFITLIFNICKNKH